MLTFVVFLLGVDGCMAMEMSRKTTERHIQSAQPETPWTRASVGADHALVEESLKSQPITTVYLVQGELPQFCHDLDDPLWKEHFCDTWKHQEALRRSALGVEAIQTPANRQNAAHLRRSNMCCSYIPKVCRAPDTCSGDSSCSHASCGQIKAYLDFVEKGASNVLKKSGVDPLRCYTAALKTTNEDFCPLISHTHADNALVSQNPEAHEASALRRIAAEIARSSNSALLERSSVNDGRALNTLEKTTEDKAQVENMKVPGTQVPIGAAGQPGSESYMNDATIGFLASGCKAGYLTAFVPKALSEYSNEEAATLTHVFTKLGVADKYVVEDIESAQACWAKCTNDLHCEFFTYITPGFPFSIGHKLCFLKDLGNCNKYEPTHWTKLPSDLGKLSGVAGDEQVRVVPSDDGDHNIWKRDHAVGGVHNHEAYGFSLAGSCNDADKPSGLIRAYFDQSTDKNIAARDYVATFFEPGVQTSAPVSGADCVSLCQSDANCKAWTYFEDNYFFSAFKGTCWHYKAIVDGCPDKFGSHWFARNAHSGKEH